MTNSSLPAGSRGSIIFSVSVATEQFVAHLVVKRTNMVVGKFSYPARDGYQLLTKDGNSYIGLLTEAMTTVCVNEVLKIEMKPFIDDDSAPIGVADVRRIEDNTLKTVQPL